MNYSNEDKRWAILLAGGDGKRLSGLTQQITGDITPKQFCRVIGSCSLVEQTYRRASLAVDRDRILIAVTRTHERFYGPIVAGMPSSNLVVQPENRGTAPAILYSLFRLAERTVDARVVLFPCDHYVGDDQKFMRQVEIAFDVVDQRPELTILLGIAPDRPETNYGWIEPGEAVASGPVFAISRFWEKPQTKLADELLARGCLWNSLVIVGRLSTLLGLFLIALPRLYLSFKKIRPVLDTTFEAGTLERLYRDLQATNFSHKVLAEHPVNLAVLPVRGVCWSDLGEPRRAVDGIARNGIRARWAAA